MALRRNNEIDATSWERIKDLVAEALECRPSDHQSFAAHLALEEPSITQEVARLVASHERAGMFLDEPLALPPDFLEDLTPVQRFSAGELLCGRFRIVRLIGKGGMGEVYEAWDQELDECVAVKTLRPEVSGNEVFTSRFRREIQLARKVTHPNVCRIFESLRHQTDTEAVAVLSMELLDGQTLADHLKSKGRLTADEALPLARQMIAGLSAVHGAGIIHRDLKPSNLVLVPDGDTFRVKITDFGIAAHLAPDPSLTSMTQAGKMLGTPDYMAPEQLEHGRATIQSDIYALGLVLYEMVTGVKPFAEAAWKRLYNLAPSLKVIAPLLNPSWDYALQNCLNKDPLHRPSSVDTVWLLLNTTPPRKFPITALIATLVAVVLIIAVLIFMPRHVNPDAQEAVDEARVAIENPSKDGFAKAIQEYRRATELAPNWAPAWAELAYAYAAASNARYIDGKTALTEARLAALRAIQIDHHSGKALGALGWTQSLDFDEWPKAEDSFLTALRFSPDDGHIHYWFGVHLRKKGKFREAEKHDQLALRLTHQRDPNIWCELAFLYWTTGQIAKLDQQLNDQLKVFPNFPLTRFLYARLLKLKGHFQQSSDELSFAEKLGLNPLTILAERVSLEEYQGNTEAARRNIGKILQASRSSEVDGLLLAGDYLGLQDTNAAIDVLEAAYLKRDNTLLSIATSPLMQTLRSDPRFISLLRQLHFTDQIMQQIEFN